MTSFPPDFFWGASSAAHQIEGNNVASDFWAFENAPGSFFPDRSGDACDSYHRWREDLDLLVASGLGAYRFSLDWSRIEPVQGRFSRAELAHYRRIIDGCVERGIVPVVTLYHFTLPQWFAELDGWSGPDAVALFSRFVEAVVPILDGVEWVCTINEPNMLAMISNMLKLEERAENVAGSMPEPDETVATALIEAHHAARDILHDKTQAKVGWTIGNQNFQAEPGAEEVAAEWAWSHEDRFIEAALEDDFIGAQSYTRVRIGSQGALPVPEGVKTTITGFEYYPQAIGGAVRHIASLAPALPIIVTENGIATSDDDERIAYTAEALAGLAAAIRDGVDVRGYLHWSWLDNFEWGSYAPTFGLVAVDRMTFVRTPKPSAAWLGSIAANNGSTVAAI